MPGVFDEGLQQHGLVAVALLPVLGQAACGDGQDLRGEPLGLHPRQDQEARVVDDALQVVLPLLMVPADEALAIGQRPGAGAEAEQGHELIASASVDVVTDLAPRHGRVWGSSTDDETALDDLKDNSPAIAYWRARIASGQARAIYKGRGASVEWA